MANQTSPTYHETINNQFYDLNDEIPEGSASDTRDNFGGIETYKTDTRYPGPGIKRIYYDPYKNRRKHCLRGYYEIVNGKLSPWQDLSLAKYKEELKRLSKSPI